MGQKLTPTQKHFRKEMKKLAKQGKLRDQYGKVDKSSPFSYEKMEKEERKATKRYSRRRKISLGVIILMIWNTFAIWTWLVHFGYWQKIVEFLSPYIQQFQVIIGS